MRRITLAPANPGPVGAVDDPDVERLVGPPFV